MRLASACLGVVAVAFAACGPGGASPDAAPAVAGGCEPVADAATACPAPGEAACDVFLHCGCRDDQKCTVGTIGLACATAGWRQAGETCTSDDECARGTLCAPFFGVTRCLQLCDAAHACPDGQACYVTVHDGANPPRRIGEVCGPTCSLLAQDCAVPGLACYVSEDHCVPGLPGSLEQGVCLSAGAGAQGDPCVTMGDCQRGQLCVDPAGPPPSICAKMCDRRAGAAPSCDVGTTCRELPGLTQTGVCLP
jgi:hypothetical protein